LLFAIVHILDLALTDGSNSPGIFQHPFIPLKGQMPPITESRIDFPDIQFTHACSTSQFLAQVRQDHHGVNVKWMHRFHLFHHDSQNVNVIHQ